MSFFADFVFIPPFYSIMPIEFKHTYTCNVRSFECYTALLALSIWYTFDCSLKVLQLFIIFSNQYYSFKGVVCMRVCTFEITSLNFSMTFNVHPRIASLSFYSFLVAIKSITINRQIIQKVILFVYLSLYIFTNKSTIQNYNTTGLLRITP